MSNEHVVKIADLKVAPEPAIITTHGLGSCLAIVLYDPQVKAGGLAHIMLPSPELTKDQNHPAKFPATAIPIMLKEMDALGCQRKRIVAKLVGGANMFGSLLKFRKETSCGNIGLRNAQQTKEELKRLGIPVVAEDTGGDYGRSVEFIVSSGTVLVHSFKAGLREL